MLTRFLPGQDLCRESHVQYALNPARCQRTTVSGWTRINACFHPDQNRFSTIQNNWSKVEIAAADAFASRPQVVAKGLGSLKADHIGSERVELPG
jgi:hypothetical protein